MAAISTDWDAEFMTWGVGLGLTTLHKRDKIDTSGLTMFTAPSNSFRWFSTQFWTYCKDLQVPCWHWVIQQENHALLYPYTRILLASQVNNSPKSFSNPQVLFLENKHHPYHNQHIRARQAFTKYCTHWKVWLPSTYQDAEDKWYSSSGKIPQNRLI